MKLHVLTAVSRPDNLSAVGASIAEAARRAPAVDVAWHCRFDVRRRHVGGQKLKNDMLDAITDGWVVILDDDTVMHKRFAVAVSSLADANPVLRGIVVSQKRTTGRVLVAAPENVKLSEIDAGQAVLRRDLIADHRLPASYAGDGLWLEAILTGRDDVVYTPEVLSLHNQISGIDVSETVARMKA